MSASKFKITDDWIRWIVLCSAFIVFIIILFYFMRGINDESRFDKVDIRIVYYNGDIDTISARTNSRLNLDDGCLECRRPVKTLCCSVRKFEIIE